MLSKITSNSAPTLQQSRLLSPCLCASPQRGRPDEGVTLVPAQTSAPSKTLSDGHLLNSLLLSEIKRRHFPTRLHPFPSPLPEKTAGIGPFGAVLLLSSVYGRRDELGTLWEREEKRGSREKWGRNCLQKYCDLKRKLLIMEYNKKKKRVVAFSFPFFIWCCYHCLFLRINISTVAFCFDVPFLRMLFLFLYCNLFDLLWLFTPFQMSIGKKKKKKKAQYCPNL